VETISVAPRVEPWSPRHLVFVVPLVLLHLACGLVFVVGVSGAAVRVFLVTVVVQIFGITLGYHRLLSHRSFKTTRLFQFVLAACGALALQNGPLWWVGHHRHHHRFPDDVPDPHSPRVGLFWSHMGWLFSPDCIPTRNELVRDLAQYLELRWLNRYAYVIVFCDVALVYLLGEVLRRTDPQGGATGAQLVVWGCILSTVCTYHIIWSGNSIGHRFGTRRFPTHDDSRNNAVVALLTLGDGWHHNHHYVPYSARHGFRWWELDVNYAILKVLAWSGLVWDLKLPPKTVQE
jgi:stearoyl-CoA desaturase (Delta-9 desaturase)